MTMKTQQSKIYGTQQKMSGEGSSYLYKPIAKKQEKLVTNYLTLQLEELEKEQQEKLSVSRRNEITKIRA